MIPGQPPTLLASEDWDDIGEFWPMAAFRASSDWSTVTPVWRRQDGVGMNLEALPAADGSAILFAASGQRIYVATATHDGLGEIFLNLPRSTYSMPISSWQGSEEHLAWTPRWLLAFDPATPGPPAIAHAEPTDGGEVTGPSAFGLLDDGGIALVTGLEPNRITLWRVEREAPRLRFLWRGGLPGGIQAVGLARSRAGTVLVASGADGDMAFTRTTSHLRAWRWDGSCMTEVLQAEFDLPKSQFGDVTSGDLDGDGIDEIAWAGGERVFVLGFDGQGLPVIRADLPQSGGTALRLKILDGNGDGINELWTIIEDSPAYGPPNPTSAWMLGPPEPLTCASDADCGEDLPLCGPAARCGDCLVDADCEFGETCAETEGRLLCRP